MKNTTSQGAFIVCNSSDSESNELNYMVAGFETLQDAIHLEIISEEVPQSNCSTLFYNLDHNGTLKEKETSTLRPAFQVENQPCIMGCQSNNSSILLSCCK